MGNWMFALYLHCMYKMLDEVKMYSFNLAQLGNRYVQKQKRDASNIYGSK